MSITWKKNFKPDLILEKITGARTVSPEGDVSFSGFDVYEHLPVLASMLDFPPAAERVNKSSLIWSALVQAKGYLGKASFEAAINQALRKELSTSIKRYALVTSLSVRSKEIPRSIKVFDATIKFLPKGIPKTFDQRHATINKHKLSIPDTPVDFLPIQVAVQGKSPTAAAQQAIEHVDVFRGLTAIYVNFAMQWGFGGSTSYEPINRVRCGGRHTIHTPDGKIATEAVWFEPNFRPAKIYDLKDAAKLFEVIKRDLGRVARSPYCKELTNALIKYARAFDEPDANTAFVKLWSALELLTTPCVADYDKLVRRCSFLYTDGKYHQQVLKHLVDYRNRSVHSGVEGSDARTNCFLLQEYFRTALHFYKGNHFAFSSLNEANEFLDLPTDKTTLMARLRILRKAIRYVSPVEK